MSVNITSDIAEAAPILIFDSGVGGLTVYDALRRTKPTAPIIYAADFAGLPYGTKSEAEIAARVAGLLGRMSERYRPRLICIACNTASTIALGMVRDVLEIPIVGTVPAIKPAAQLTHTGTIGLIGTEATIRQRYVDDLQRDFASDKRLLRIAAPELVGEAETKLRGGSVNKSALRRIARRLREMAGDERMDTLVLACTHFPLLGPELSKAFGNDVTMVHGGSGIATRIKHLTWGQSFAEDVASRFVITGPLSGADGLESALTERGFGPPETF